MGDLVDYGDERPLLHDHAEAPDIALLFLGQQPGAVGQGRQGSSSAPHTAAPYFTRENIPFA